MKTSKIKIWIKAFRLRTLPLALSNACMGIFLALADGAFRWSVFVLTLFTIVSLQILSNLANDYGDALSGKDTEERVGPQRVTASGLVTKTEIKRMIVFFVILSFILGSLLIFIGLRLSIKETVVFFALGISAIIAAIKYTVGKNPYGYKGLGDIFVFLFFGWVGVIGTFYLQTHYFEFSTLYPASAIGLLSTGVLNINNLRDAQTDKKTGKNTLAVRHGASFGQIYHVVLIVTALLLAIVYTISNFSSSWQWIFLITVPLFIRNIWRVYHYQSPDEINNELKNLSLATFFFALTFGIGLII